MSNYCRIFFFGLTALFCSVLSSHSAFCNVRLAFNPASLNFGDVSLTGAKPLTIEVWDTSLDDIEIDRFDFAGADPGDFAVSSDSGTPFVVLADSGNIIKIVVTFSPSATGPRTAFLEVESSDGNVYIPLSGVGGEKSSLDWSINSIDFGSLAPGVKIDTVIELYSTGLDSTAIAGMEIISVDTSFEIQTVSGVQAPFMIAPGDSVAVDVSFQGLPPLGEKDAQLIVFGATLNEAECDLSGVVEYGSFKVEPSLVDFGVMYAGQVRDTTVMVENTSEVPISINSTEDIGIDPSGDDFTLLIPVDTQIVIPPGDQIPLTIRANPGLITSHQAQLQVVTQSAQPNYDTAGLVVSVVRPSIIAPPIQSLPYFCAVSGPAQITLPISDTGSGSIVITDFVSNDINVALTTNPPFPDTLAPGEVQSLSVQFDPSRSSGDTLLLYGLGGEQLMFVDTVQLQPEVSFAGATVSQFGLPSSIQANFDVSTTTALGEFDIDTIVVHVSVDDTNVASIDSSQIKLSSGAPENAVITAIQMEPGGYAVTISSSSPINLAAGNSLLTVGFSRYVSIADSSNVFVAIETPEKSGCLDWALDTISIHGATGCGAALMQEAMTGAPITLSAVLIENPITGSDADVSILADVSVSQVSYSLTNAIGESVSEGTFDIARGENYRAFSLSGLPSGAYILRISAPNGYSTGLRLLKLD